jgi:hypothetical protein
MFFRLRILTCNHGETSIFGQSCFNYATPGSACQLDCSLLSFLGIVNKKRKTPVQVSGVVTTHIKKKQSLQEVIRSQEVIRCSK